MNLTFRVPLTTSPEQTERLLALQREFALVCNALAPIVAQSRIWNRVALHHMSYKSLREQFPALGSQMVCNAIYSVSRTSRAVFQDPKSPYNINRLCDRPLPTLRFADNCPVYFDRHTLSIRNGLLSLYTLDGRMRFQIALGATDEAAFHASRLREIVLGRRNDGTFELSLWLASADEPLATKHPDDGAEDVSAQGEIPEYVTVEEVA